METVGMDFAEMIMPFGTALLALVITLTFSKLLS